MYNMNFGINVVKGHYEKARLNATFFVKLSEIPYHLKESE